MPQGNVVEPANDAVAYFASPLSASECGSAKHGQLDRMISVEATERNVASATTLLALTQLGQRQDVTGNPKGEMLAGGTLGSLRSTRDLGYVLSGVIDGVRMPPG